MPDRVSILVSLPKNRDVSGRLTVRDALGRELGSYEVLGRGSRGPGDTSLQVNGNTPTGEYDGTERVDTSAWNAASYGPYGAVRLKPLGGNALVAHEVVGRDGLLIHGGAPGGKGYFRGAGALRATHGCLRLSNSDIQQLIWLLNEQHLDPVRKVCKPITVNVNVVETGQ